jgi:chaperone BCS1
MLCHDMLTTNHPERLDPALTRPGRVDFRLEMGLPTTTQIQDLFFVLFSKSDNVQD